MMNMCPTATTSVSKMFEPFSPHENSLHICQNEHGMCKANQWRCLKSCTTDKIQTLRQIVWLVIEMNETRNQPIRVFIRKAVVFMRCNSIPDLLLLLCTILIRSRETRCLKVEFYPQLLNVHTKLSNDISVLKSTHFFSAHILKVLCRLAFETTLRYDHSLEGGRDGDFWLCQRTLMIIISIWKCFLLWTWCNVRACH